MHGKVCERQPRWLAYAAGSESSGVLMNEFFPADDVIPSPPDDVEPESAAGPATSARPANSTLTHEFRKREFNYTVSRMRMGKSPGMDGITKAMALQVATSAPSFMKAMYDSSLKDGLFPEKWKEARVVTLLKGADKDRAEPRSYRPISLLSGLGKILERMLVERLLRRMDGKWNERQFGFVKNKCTEDAWSNAQDLVKASNSKHVIGVFVDFKGAFDYLL